MADKLSQNPTSPDRPSSSSTASSSLYRRHGLSPRQRRLLQAAARARAHNAVSDGSSPHSEIHSNKLNDGSPMASPSSECTTPTSLSTSLSPIEQSTPSTPAKSIHNNTLDKWHKKNSTSGSCATATTDATTVSIGSEFRTLRLSPVHDREEGEVVDAMRGKVSDRVKRFSGHVGEKSDVKNNSSKHKTVKCISLTEGDDENDTKDGGEISMKGPLNNQLESDKQPSPRTIQVQPKPKSSYQKQTQPISTAPWRGWKNDILKTAAKQMELRYYRVVYPGVVSLLSELNVGRQLDATPVNVASLTALPAKEKSPTTLCNDSGVYIGYGEIVATSSPEITIPISDLKMLDHDNTQPANSEKCIRAIRVDSIMTGGYNADDKECLASDTSVHPSRKNSSVRHYGYLLLDDQSGSTIAESIAPSKPGCVGPPYENGSFVYRVCASSPVRVLSGPDFNAPSMKFALLPGTVHDISLRVSIPVSDPICDDDDVLVDDADAGEVKFLRLGHKRGWVADRRVDAIDGDSKRLRVSYLMQDVTDERSLNNTFSGPSPAGSANSSLSRSFDCSSLNLSLTASSVMTPLTVNAQRKRTRRRRREAPNLPIMLQESRHHPGLGESFDTESSATGYTGYGSGTVVSAGGDSMDTKSAAVETFYLMRVLAPMGLKILDAPHFQVSNLIHTPNEKNKARSHSPVGISPFARTNAMIGSNSIDSSPSSLGGARRNQRIRFLARGQFFEASRRMESTDAASLYTNGQGLVKLADGSGWVIVPFHQDLVAQYQIFRGGSVTDHEVIAYEEIGDATIHKRIPASNRLTPPDRKQHDLQQPVTWMRIVAPNGVKVLLPPTAHIQRLNNTQSNLTPPKYPTHGEKAIKIKPSSSSQDSEVASAVSSSFFDSVWSKVTPAKPKASVSSSNTTVLAANTHIKQQLQQPQANQVRNPPQPSVPVVACGIVVPIEHSDSMSDASERCFVRLFHGQGWIPQRVGGVVCAVEVGTPEARFGSFWFRVQARNGIDVRHGPSSEAPFITSDCGHSFRFDCGEFLRSSEVLTIFHQPSGSHNKSGMRVECFARLYRRNQNLGTDASSQNMLSRYSSIQSLTLPGEWVMVHNSDELFLEECSTPPIVERNCECWRCSAIQNVQIRSGPSFRADITGKVIRADQEFFVTEKVTSGDQVTWYRLKSEEGWVNSITEAGDPVVHCHMAEFSRKVVHQIINRKQNAH